MLISSEHDHCQTAADVLAAARHVQSFRSEIARRPILAAKAEAQRRAAEEIVRVNAELAAVEAAKLVAATGAEVGKAWVDPEPLKKLTVSRVVKVGARALGYTVAVIRSSQKTTPIVEARQLISWCASDITGRSTIIIGDEINRDHSTVFHSVTKVDAHIRAGSEFGKRALKLRAEILALHAKEIGSAEGAE